MTFQQLKFVMEIARFGSINKAAQSLFNSQSNISNSVKDLESELGIEIFIRNNRGVELTNKGREFISYAKPLLEQKEKIEALYINKNQKPTTRFDISSQRYPFMVDAFVRFMNSQTANKYEYSVKETDMYQILDDIYNNDSDIGIIFISDTTQKYINKVLSMKNIEFHEIKKVEPHVFFSTNHPLANKQSVNLEEMFNYPFVMFEQESGVSLDFSEEIMLMDFQRPDKIIFVHDRATVYNIIANTNAYSIGSGILPEKFSDRRIKKIAIQNHCEKMKLGWIKLKSKRITTEMIDFIGYLNEAIDENVTD